MKILLADWVGSDASRNGGTGFLDLATGNFSKNRRDGAGYQRSPVSGWYADYAEGVFAIYAYDGDIFVSWNWRSIKVTREVKFSWERRLISRRVEVFVGDTVIMSFSYMGALSKIKRPLSFIGGILMMDDDADFMSDLPSFAHSCLAGDGRIDFSKSLNIFNARRMG